MLKEVIDFIKESKSEISFSLNDKILNIKLQRLENGGIKVLNHGITEIMVNQMKNEHNMLNEILCDWNNGNEFYTKKV